METAAFDIQKIKAIEAGMPVPDGEDYSKGEMMGFWNVREHVLHMDGKGKSKDKVLSWCLVCGQCSTILVVGVSIDIRKD